MGILAPAIPRIASAARLIDDVIFARFDLLTVAAPIRGSLCLTRGKNWRRGPELNRRIELLQSSALPLGYRALLAGAVKVATTARGSSRTRFESKIAEQGRVPTPIMGRRLGAQRTKWTSSSPPSCSVPQSLGCVGSRLRLRDAGSAGGDEGAFVF